MAYQDRCRETLTSRFEKFLTSINAIKRTVLRSQLVVSGFAVIAVVVFLNISLLTGIVQTSSGHICAPLPSFARRMQNLGRLDIIINFFIPYTTIIVFSSLTAHRLTIFYRQRTSIIYTNTTARRKSTFRTSNINNLSLCHLPHIQHHPKTETQTTRLCIALCFTFLVLGLPSHVMRFWVMIASLSDDHYVINKNMFLWQNLLLQLFFTRFAVNFFVYLACSETFRKSLYSLFCGCLTTKRNSADKHRYMPKIVKHAARKNTITYALRDNREHMLKPLNLI